MQISKEVVKASFFMSAICGVLAAHAYVVALG